MIRKPLINTAMVGLDRIFRRRNMTARILMMIHDAVWVEAREEEAPEVKRLIGKMMTRAAKIRVPLVVDIK